MICSALKGHLILRQAAGQLPTYMAEMLLQQLDSFDVLGERLVEIETRIAKVIAPDSVVKKARNQSLNPLSGSAVVYSIPARVEIRQCKETLDTASSFIHDVSPSKPVRSTVFFCCVLEGRLGAEVNLP